MPTFERCVRTGRVVIRSGAGERQHDARMSVCVFVHPERMAFVCVAFVRVVRMAFVRVVLVRVVLVRVRVTFVVVRFVGVRLVRVVAMPVEPVLRIDQIRDAVLGSRKEHHAEHERDEKRPHASGLPVTFA